MSHDMARWQENNDAYLSAALVWLRLRLARLADNGAPGSTETASEERVGFFQRLLPKSSSEAENKPEVEDEEAVIRARMAAAADATDMPPPAAIILSRRFGLSEFELHILLLCAALELDTRIADLCARAQANPNRPYPTFALAMALFDEPAWQAFSPDGGLRRWQLLEINQPGAQPLTTSPLRADERIVSYLKGLNFLDDRLATFLTPLESTGNRLSLPESQQAMANQIVQRLERSVADRQWPIVQLVGPDGLSKQLIARQVATQVGLQLYRLPADMLPTPAGELETLIRLWERETIMLPVALYLDARDVESSTTENNRRPALHRFLARNSSLCFLDSRETRTDLERSTLSLDVAKPTPTEQQALWRKALVGSDVGDAPARLAGQFDLNAPTIVEIALEVLTAGSFEEAPLPDRLWQTCLIRTRPQLDQLAQRLDPKATWNDIVLPEEQTMLLRQIAGQVGQRSQVYDAWGFRQKMNRGLGINSLFAGDSGTGKTMAAEVIANELRLNLYRIDLSAVVSKYIGETEKNLRKLFDAAEDGGAILFFDEADALFGKRSEVKDSHDRYANIETSYLLQRMESYRGLSILATNMKSALDQAFLRRLRFIVDFPFPGRTERKRIWQKAFPPATPTNGLDTERLARFNLTGGNIHSIALNAAFLAAGAGEKVTMPLVLSAARAEFRKLERPINEANFRWEEPER